MIDLKQMPEDQRMIYSKDFFSGNYNHELYLKRAVDDGSCHPKFYISVHTNVNGQSFMQGYVYFYLDFKTKTSTFIGIRVEDEYRSLNIASFLVAHWINFCLDNNFNFLGINPKQRKPFLLYLLKTYGFEVLDKSLYITRPDVISILQSFDFDRQRKIISFKDERHEKAFIASNIYKHDNYEIVHDKECFFHLDDVIIPFQSFHKNAVNYELLDPTLAESKTNVVLARHKK